MPRGRERDDPDLARRVTNGGHDTQIFRAIGIDAEIDSDRPDGRLIANAESRRDRGRPMRDRAQRLHTADLPASDDPAVDEHGADEIPQRLSEGQGNAILDA